MWDAMLTANNPKNPHDLTTRISRVLKVLKNPKVDGWYWQYHHQYRLDLIKFVWEIMKVLVTIGGVDLAVGLATLWRCTTAPDCLHG
jgi:hypothetical protein